MATENFFTSKISKYVYTSRKLYFQTAHEISTTIIWAYYSGYYRNYRFIVCLNLLKSRCVFQYLKIAAGGVFARCKIATRVETRISGRGFSGRLPQAAPPFHISEGHPPVIFGRGTRRTPRPPVEPHSLFPSLRQPSFISIFPKFATRPNNCILNLTIFCSIVF